MHRPASLPMNEQQVSSIQQTQDPGERRYRLLYSGTPAMLHSIDAQGQLVQVSDVWLTSAFSRGSLSRDRYQAVCKDGTLIDVMVSSVIQRDTGDLPLLSLTVMQDVTEHKRAQRELVAQHEQLRVTLHSIGDGVITTGAIHSGSGRRPGQSGDGAVHP